MEWNGGLVKFLILFTVLTILSTTSFALFSKDSAYATVDPKLVSFELRVGKKTVIQMSDISEATAEDSIDDSYVNLKLNHKGATKLHTVSKNNTGEKLAIVVDGRVVSTPTIKQEISGENIHITGNFTKAQADDLAARINVAVAHRPVN